MVSILALKLCYMPKGTFTDFLDPLPCYKICMKNNFILQNPRPPSLPPEKANVISEQSL